MNETSIASSQEPRSAGRFHPLVRVALFAGLLVAIAAISLLFTRSYPAGLHDLVVGVNRWTYRVVAYVALMTDVYPPFRLDQGGTEPVTGATEPAAVGQPVSADVPATGTTSEQ